MFLKAQSSRVFENVVQQIEDAIVNGDYAPGDRLPSEKQLLAMLDVSRGTLRESLRALEQKGLINIRPGAKGGIFVRELNSDQMAQSLELFIRSQKVSLADLSQFREDLEGLVTARAAQQCRPQDRHTLDELQSQALKLKDQGLKQWTPFMKLDVDIHMAIARIAANPLHYFFLETVHSFFHAPNVRAYLPRTQEVMDLTYESLVAIVKAVEQGDSGQAQSQAIEHVRLFFKFMAETEQAAKHNN
jgi:GntR family transcriptional repressor for pyruvate dehydrogenase complex